MILKLVLTCTADTVYRAKVAAKFLQVAGRTDVPVGIGLRGDPGAEHQRLWVEDYDLGAYRRDFLNVEPLRLRITDTGMTVRDENGHALEVALSWRDLDGFLDHLTARLLAG